nr:flavodoxin domain-containing protein [Aestuariibacter sp. A3R04]
MRPGNTDKTDFLVAYASQTGNARALAEMHANEKAQHHNVALLPLSSVTLERLQQAKRALFVVSTYGHGEPPDNGRSFFRMLRKTNKEPGCLSSLVFDVVALGDSQYPHFCAFGEQLYKQLQVWGAIPASSITRLDHAKGEDGLQDDTERNHSPLDEFVLSSRQQLNHGTAHPLFEITLTPGNSDWQAGDILDVMPQNSADAIETWLQSHDIDGSYTFEINNQNWTARQWLATRQLNTPGPDACLSDTLTALPRLATRSYTIASIPKEGVITLIVRRHMRDGNNPGIASGWLTAFAEEHSAIQGRIRVNPACHLSVGNGPLLLIGAGSGIAGLRAQVAKFTDTRSAIKPALLWVIYGERDPLHDDIAIATLPIPNCHNDNIRVDSVFSRCPDNPQYVQDKLRQHAEEIKQLIMQGLQIYVCGSYAGMGESVHATLIDILGDDDLQMLTDHHRYHRDIY